MDKENTRLRQSLADKIKRISLVHELSATPLAHSEIKELQSIITRLEEFAKKLEIR